MVAQARTRRTDEFVPTSELIRQFAIKNNLRIRSITSYNHNSGSFGDSGFMVDFGRKGRLNFVEESIVDNSGLFDDEVSYTFIYTDKNKREYSKSYRASGVLNGKKVSMTTTVRRHNERSGGVWGKPQEEVERTGARNYWFYDSK